MRPCKVNIFITIFTSTLWEQRWSQGKDNKYGKNLLDAQYSAVRYTP